jgi:hypothetical protein
MRYWQGQHPGVEQDVPVFLSKPKVAGSYRMYQDFKKGYRSGDHCEFFLVHFCEEIIKQVNIGGIFFNKIYQGSSVQADD